MPEIMVTVDVPDGDVCWDCDFVTKFNKFYYCDAFLIILQTDVNLIPHKCPACLEACERAKPESVTDCNGLEEK